MDDRVSRLKTPKECENFARNALRLGGQDLATQAKQQAVKLRAAQYGATTDAERECLEAVYAYEEVLTTRNGKAYAGFTHLADDQAPRNYRRHRTGRESS